jgi:hypothetical protein
MCGLTCVRREYELASLSSVAAVIWILDKEYTLVEEHGTDKKEVTLSLEILRLL